MCLGLEELDSNNARSRLIFKGNSVCKAVNYLGNGGIMSEIEVPLEKVQEDIQHIATHGDAGHSSFMNRAAILSAFLAVLAAISALFAGHFANEAMIEQIQSSDHWAFYQAKGIKLSIAELKSAQGVGGAEVEAKIEKYKHEQEEIKEKAEEKEKESQHHLHKHENLAASVTFFQIAIALTAIAVLTRKKVFLLVSGSLGSIGAIWLFINLFR